jgi:hypothetical protein
LERFRDAIERTKPGWIYLSAAHPFNPADLIPDYPDIYFFREAYAREVSANQIVLLYDREQANYEAGRAIAALLGQPEFLERIGAAEPDLAKPRVGILVAVNTRTVEREIASFVEGFSEFADPERIEQKLIGNVTDRVKARRQLDRMKEEAVAVVFLKTYVLSGFCLEYLAKGTGVAVVEGPLLNQAHGNTVLLMLVDDFQVALQGMAEYIDRGSQTRPPGEVIVPVRLQWNQSYESLLTGVVAGENQQ